ncbi:MAG: amidohydrolase family protein, partial [Pseudomonadales bacterium]|nr:amidohydrolase family protein [Pseudomonadales bacterium]
CVHHLWFSDQDYPRLGNFIKCNPAIKAATDRDALIQALHNNQIDIIATDHAPHTLDEKQRDYNQAPAGLPLVEHALLCLFDHVKHQQLSIEQVVEKTAHNPAKRYAVKDRGFIREGYYADLVLVDMNQTTEASHENSRYLCGWTPFNDYQFSSSIRRTWVNGCQVFDGRIVNDQTISSMRLAFDR